MTLTFQSYQVRMLVLSLGLVGNQNETEISTTNSLYISDSLLHSISTSALK